MALREKIIFYADFAYFVLFLVFSSNLSYFSSNFINLKKEKEQKKSQKKSMEIQKIK